jgi:hypothetical protein
LLQWHPSLKGDTLVRFENDGGGVHVVVSCLCHSNQALPAGVDKEAYRDFT